MVSVLVALAALVIAGTTVPGLMVGMFARTAGALSAQVAHQSRIFAAAPHALGSVNTLYMFSAFLGGAVGAEVGTAMYTGHGVSGVLQADAVFFALALIVYAVTTAGREINVPAAS